jgi:CheY-like chemotaxis protein
MPPGLPSAAACPATNPGGPGRAASPAHILVVDDDPAVRGTVALVLESAGYRVGCAADGEAGWDAVCSARPDLLITDHEMPKLTGLELLRRVRAGSRHLPAIMISGCPPRGEADLNESPVALPGVPGHVLEFQARLEIHRQTRLAAAAGPAHGRRDAARGMGETPGRCERAPAAGEGSRVGGRGVDQRDDRATRLGGAAHRALPRRRQDDRGGRTAVHRRARPVPGRRPFRAERSGGDAAGISARLRARRARRVYTSRISRTCARLPRRCGSWRICGATRR